MIPAEAVRLIDRINSSLFILFSIINVVINIISGFCHGRLFSKNWIKKGTVKFAQYLYGRTSIIQKEDSSSLVICNTLFKNNSQNIGVISYFNFSVISMTLLSALNIFIQQEIVYDCVNIKGFYCSLANDSSYAELDITDCLEYRNKVVCSRLQYFPLETFGFIGGFLKIGPPIGFKLSMLLHLQLPKLLKRKCKGFTNKKHYKKVITGLLYICPSILSVVAIYQFFINNSSFINTDILSEKIINISVILIMIICCPWSSLDRDKDNKDDDEVTIELGEYKSGERQPLLPNKYSNSYV